MTAWLGNKRHAESAQALGLAWVSGVEVSVDFLGQTIHIVGLGVDSEHPGLRALLQHHRNSRIHRVPKPWPAGLAAVGIADAYAGALQYAGQPEQLSRTHFARHLVADRALRHGGRGVSPLFSAGKPGYAPHGWAACARRDCADSWRPVVWPCWRTRGATSWSACTMQILLDRFAQAGGQAIEVTTSAHTPAQTHSYAALARPARLGRLVRQ